MENKKYHYYRIYDDHEELDFIKSTIEYKEIRKLLEKFENIHKEYYNPEFLDFLKERDPEAEIIEVTNIFYD
ncbi:MAG: hypothetical protein A2W11_06570 [Ignavibacteria bacterium RBG_16_35_7]|nr:MAG: hypothetical protein A2W11_06570 [Ignavibacteria bacterium RBG_16_35_7]